LVVVDHIVKLNSIPDLDFPTELQNRIHFDPIKKQLVFRGFMCKADYDRLTSLHDSLEYRRAIEYLFQISTEIRSPHYNLIKYTLVALAALCFALALVVWWQLLRQPVAAANAPAMSSWDQKGLSNGPQITVSDP
jgi:hypothetical protein